MLKLPKSSAEILAEAKRVRPSTPLAEIDFHHLSSVFSAKPTSSSLTSDEGILLTRFRPTNVHSVDNLCFVDPVTPRSLEAALEIKEIGKDHEEDLFEDMDLGAWVFLLYFICYVVYYTSVFYYARPQRALVNPNPQSKAYQAHKRVCPPPSAFKMC